MYGWGGEVHRVNKLPSFRVKQALSSPNFKGGGCTLLPPPLCLKQNENKKKYKNNVLYPAHVSPPSPRARDINTVENARDITRAVKSINIL